MSFLAVCLYFILILCCCVYQFKSYTQKKKTTKQAVIFILYVSVILCACLCIIWKSHPHKTLWQLRKKTIRCHNWLLLILTPGLNCLLFWRTLIIDKLITALFESPSAKLKKKETGKKKLRVVI